MPNDDQPDPDVLLKAIQLEESKHRTGKLKIFFGMSAGVGKTYAMLEEAKERLQEGISIIVGTINTHGRKETEALLQGLPIIPEKWVKYKDTVFEELDLEAILQQKPKIVLIDELAHTNVPGSRHPKRWQDVMEILDAGIDVYTTLNIQHVESRKDLVESFAGIQIRETVPDIILERASTIELVDISPTELLERLNEGKVYLGEQSQIAARNFFKEDTLTALREIALRFTAEKVDHDLHSILSQGKRWSTREKLMVVITPNVYSQQLIRKTRRRAFEFDAPWMVVYVDVGNVLSDEEQTRLTNHLNLAQELGAEVLTTFDVDVATAVQRIAKFRNVTQIVIGRSSTKEKWKFFHKNLLDRLVAENQELDILILRQDRLTKVYQDIHSVLKSFRSPIYEYAISVGSIIGLTLLGYALLPLIHYKAVGFIFLLGILLLSFVIGQGPIFLAGILSTITWNFFFIPPLFSLSVRDTDDIILMLIYFCTVTIIGLLTSRSQKQDDLLKSRERKLRNLYEIEREIASAANFTSLRMNMATRLQSIFDGKFDILIKKENENQLILDSHLPLLQDEKERATANWVFLNGKIAGWTTSTLSSAKGLYLPVQFGQAIIGVLVYFPKSERSLSIDEMNFLQIVAQQIGIYIERHLFSEQQRNQNYTNQVERLQSSIIQTINQKFYAPLNKIFETTGQLKENMSAVNENDKNLAFVQNIEKEARDLVWMIENLLSFAEFDSGFVKFDKTKNDIKSFVEFCIIEIKPFLNGRQIILKFPEKEIFISFDPRLIEQALKNILIQLVHAYPEKNPIEISGQEEENNFRISISIEGPPISFDVFPINMEKSYPKKELTSAQMSFFIVKSILEIHQGKIEVHNDGRLMRISLILPY